MTSYLFPEGWARRLLWSSCKWHSKEWLAAGSAAPAPGAAGCHPCDMPGNPSSSLNCPVTAASPSCCTSSLSQAWVHAPHPGTLLFFAEDRIFIFNAESFTSVAVRVSFARWHSATGGVGWGSYTKCTHMCWERSSAWKPPKQPPKHKFEIYFFFSDFERSRASSSGHQLRSLRFLFHVTLWEAVFGRPLPAWRCGAVPAALPHASHPVAGAQDAPRGGTQPERSHQL